MISEKLKKLIELLIERTSARTAIWSKGSADNQFKLSVSEGTAITINYWVHDYNEPEMYIIAIFNQNGDQIESFNTHLDGNSDVLSFNLLKELHKVVSNQYYKVEETMDILLASLQTDKIIGNDGSFNTKESIEEDDLPF